MLYLQVIKIECTTNRKVSNKQYEKLGKANKMQEKTKKQSKIRKKNNHAIASTKLKDTPPPHAFFFMVDSIQVKRYSSVPKSHAIPHEVQGNKVNVVQERYSVMVMHSYRFMHCGISVA